MDCPGSDIDDKYTTSTAHLIIFSVSKGDKMEHRTIKLIVEYVVGLINNPTIDSQISNTAPNIGPTAYLQEFVYLDLLLDRHSSISSTSRRGDAEHSRHCIDDLHYSGVFGCRIDARRSRTAYMNEADIYEVIGDEGFTRLVAAFFPKSTPVSNTMYPRGLRTSAEPATIRISIPTCQKFPKLRACSH